MLDYYGFCSKFHVLSRSAKILKIILKFIFALIVVMLDYYGHPA